MIGTAEDHHSNPLKIAISKFKRQGGRFISINPVRTGYSAIADEWIGIRPGSDGLFVLALVHELLRSGRVDLDYLIRYTNAPYLVIDEPDAPDHGLFARDASGRPLSWDSAAAQPAPAQECAHPTIIGRVEVSGRQCAPVFALLAERYLDRAWSPDSVELLTPLFASVTAEKRTAEQRFNQSIAQLYSKAWSAQWLRTFLTRSRRGDEATGSKSSIVRHPSPIQPWLCTEQEVGVAVNSLDAALEAIAYRFASIANALDEIAPNATVIAAGNALRSSPVWLQIVADVLGRPVMLGDSPEASIRGAALLALEAVGKIENLEAVSVSVDKVFEPDMRRHARYREGLLRQQELYDRLFDQGFPQRR